MSTESEVAEAEFEVDSETTHKGLVCWWLNSDGRPCYCAWGDDTMRTLLVPQELAGLYRNWCNHNLEDDLTETGVIADWLEENVEVLLFHNRESPEELLAEQAEGLVYLTNEHYIRNALKWWRRCFKLGGTAKLEAADRRNKARKQMRASDYARRMEAEYPRP